ncbi:PDR/VanB family oxidoreductase [Streptomyces qinglanensis]|uniref:PDR/VanB family oxidoreductase n=1 Tax=Streptomyces qinglanensis TaxID=943816 RepID=UPI003D74ED0E
MTRADTARTAAVLALTAGTALLAKRAMGRRIERSPLWPMPALDRPVSGTMGLRRTGPDRSERTVRVTGRHAVADRVVQLRLGAPDGAALPGWEPGAHLDLVLPSGLVRQYSLCGDPAEADTWTVAVRLTDDSRGGSRDVHEQLHEGAELRVRGPRNRFPLAEAPAYLFLAGGIGITPLLPMIRAVAAAGAPWRLVFGGRTRASMPFLDELAALDGGQGRVTLVPQDEAGHPDLAGALAGMPPEAAVHCCGPAPLLDTVTALCESEAAPGGGLHLERFTAQPPDAAGPNHPFEVELRRSGRTLAVPADSTALAAVRAACPDTAYSCEQGFCGTCRTRVLQGPVEHRDELLSDAERDAHMLLCVSRARGAGQRLVLDL